MKWILFSDIMLKNKELLKLKSIKMKIQIAIIILFFSILKTNAQDTTKRWAVTASVADIRYPFLGIREDQTPEPLLRGPFRPSFSVAIERNWNKSVKNRWFQTLELQYFKYKYVDFGGSIITEIGYEHRFWQRLILGTRLGFGKQFAWKDDQYQIYENGDWKTVKDYGSVINRWAVQGRINAGWQITPNLDALLGLKAQFVTPFYKPLEQNANISTAVELGVRWHF